MEAHSESLELACRLTRGGKKALTFRQADKNECWAHKKLVFPTLPLAAANPCLRVA
jgi:hypothetical protein